VVKKVTISSKKHHKIVTIVRKAEVPVRFEIGIYLIDKKNPNLLVRFKV